MDNLGLASIIAAAVSAVAACVACFVTYKTAKQQTISGGVNHCNERFAGILRDLNLSIEEQNENCYRTLCQEFFELLGHEFVLWKSNLLPSSVFMVWPHYTSHMLRNSPKLNGKTLKDIWNEMVESGQFGHTRQFCAYVSCLLHNEGEWKLIKALKRQKMF